jgi:hypothetical protein
MPLLKEAPKPQTQEEPLQTSLSDGIMQWEGVPVDILRYFDMELGTTPQKDVGKLKDVFEWAKDKCKDEPSMGNIMQKISILENQLGAPAIDEKRFSKMWVWVKMSKHIDDLEKRREALRKKWLI